MELMSDYGHFLSLDVWTGKTFVTGVKKILVKCVNVLHSTNVTLWYGVTFYNPIRPYIIENEQNKTVTVNAKHYSDLLVNSGSWSVPFMQAGHVVPGNSTTFHTARISINMLFSDDPFIDVTFCLHNLWTWRLSMEYAKSLCVPYRQTWIRDDTN